MSAGNIMSALRRPQIAFGDPRCGHFWWRLCDENQAKIPFSVYIYTLVCSFCAAARVWRWERERREFVSQTDASISVESGKERKPTQLSQRGNLVCALFAAGCLGESVGGGPLVAWLAGAFSLFPAAASESAVQKKSRWQKLPRRNSNFCRHQFYLSPLL